MPYVGGLERLIQASGDFARSQSARRQLALQERYYQLSKTKFEAEAAEAQRIAEERKAIQTMNELEAQRIGEHTLQNVREEGIQRVVDSAETREIGGFKIKVPNFDIAMEEIRKANEQQQRNERRAMVAGKLPPAAAERYLKEMYAEDVQRQQAEARQRAVEGVQDMIVNHALDDYRGGSYQQNEARLSRAEAWMEGIASGAVPVDEGLRAIEKMAAETAKSNEEQIERTSVKTDIEEQLALAKNPEVRDSLTKLLTKLPALDAKTARKKFVEAVYGVEAKEDSPDALFEKATSLLHRHEDYPFSDDAERRKAYGDILMELTGFQAGSPEAVRALYGQEKLKYEGNPQILASLGQGGPAFSQPPQVEHSGYGTEFRDIGGEPVPPIEKAESGGPPVDYANKPPEEKAQIDEAAVKFIVKEKPKKGDAEKWAKFKRAHGLGQISKADVAKWLELADARKAELANPFVGPSYGTL